jgi:Carboxypeptidase regulatory-like domain
MAAGDRAEELAGRVVDEHGEAVPNALVAIVASTVPMPEIALQTDAAGRFALRLPPGRFTLRAHAPGGIGDADVERTEGAGPGDVVIVIGA